MSSYFLEHYGVAGMKWGRRRVNSLGPPVIELGPNEYRDAGGNRRTGHKSTNSSNNSSNSNNSQSSSGSGSSSKAKTKTNTSQNKSTGSNSQSNSSTTSSSSESKKFDTKGVQTGLKEGKKLAEAGAKYLEADRKKGNAKDLKSEARNMSDEDLRKVINRLSMEEKYVQAMEKEGVGRSKTDLQKTLELVGTAVSYADTALEVYDKIQRVRGR